MKKQLLLIALILLITKVSFGQVARIESTNLEVAFPVCYYHISKDYKLALEEMNYGKNYIKTGYYQYNRMLLSYRGKFSVEIINNSCEIKFVDIQYYDSKSKSWINDHGGIIVKKEQEFCDKIALEVKQTIAAKTDLPMLKKWFFEDPYILALFCKNSSTLGTEKYFNAYLKDKEINWSMKFTDIKHADKNTNKDYNFTETYVNISLNNINQYYENSFYLIKYTNSEANTLVATGTEKKATGFCRNFYMQNGYYWLIVTDKLDSPTPQNSVQSENKEANNKSVLDNADKLIKLKELFDKGILTKEEYEKEKTKLLN